MFKNKRRIKRYEVELVDEFPENIKPGIIYYARESHFIKFKCPCGCGYENTIMLTMGDKFSRANLEWGSTFQDNKISLYPSIAQASKCRSHYFIKGNKVRWAE